MLILQIAAGIVLGVLLCAALYFSFGLAVENYNKGEGEDPFAVGCGCLLFLGLGFWGAWWILK